MPLRSFIRDQRALHAVHRTLPTTPVGLFADPAPTDGVLEVNDLAVLIECLSQVADGDLAQAPELFQAAKRVRGINANDLQAAIVRLADAA